MPVSEMKRVGIFLLLGLFFSKNALADSATLDRLWKARGIQALEKIENLVKKNSQSKEKSLSKQERCNFRLENVFLGFSVPEMSKVLRETKGDSEIFKLVFMDDENPANSQINQINFTYIGKNIKTPEMSSVMKVADGWVVSFVTKVPDVIGVKGRGCIFIFPLKDPLSASAQVE